MLQDARNMLRAFAADQSGATAIEYGLITAAIAVVIMGTIFTIGTDLRTQYYDKVAAAFATLPK